MTPRHLLEPARLAGHALLRAQPDDRLVDLVRAGNDRAFEALVERHRRPLQCYCRRLVGVGRDDDALQQIFLKAYDAIHETEGPLALRPWLFRVAHNISLNLLRRRDSAYEELPDGVEGLDQPDQAFERGERLRTVLAAVRALPARQRDAIVLRELAGRSHEQIAAELGVTGGAARQLISRARDTVRAGAAAVTPLPLLARLTDGSAGAPTGARIAELTAAAGVTATATKLSATVAVTALVAGGAAHAPKLGGAEKVKGAPPSAAAAPAGERLDAAGADRSGARAAGGAGERPRERNRDADARSPAAGRGGGSARERGDEREEDVPQEPSEDGDAPDESEEPDDDGAGGDDDSDAGSDEVDDDDDDHVASSRGQSVADRSHDELDDDGAEEDD